MKFALNLTKKFFINLTLLIVSLILSIFLLPIGFLFGCIASFFQKKWYEGIDYLADSFLSMAVSIDQTGNTICKQLFNYTLKIVNSTYLQWEKSL